MKSLIWLASYPKSGNTWLRAFLVNYVFDEPDPVPVNQLHRLGVSDAMTSAYQKLAGPHFNPGDPSQTVRMRAPFFEALVKNGADVNLIKTHNQNNDAMGVRLIPEHLTKAAIYIMRDPRDMAISYASHLGLTMDKAIEGMNNVNNATAGDAKNVHQFLGRWSDHVTSWTRTKKFPVLTIRYEDMLNRPEKTFASVVRRLGMPIDRDRIEKAMRFSSFNELQKQEDEAGFEENSQHQERFFRKGGSGHYRDQLTPEQIARIEQDHGKIMRRHGYLD